MRFRFQIIRNGVCGLERELKNTFEIAHCFGRGINRHRPARVRKSAKVVEAHNMVGVRVRENDSVDATNVFAQRLGSEIGAGIDDERRLGGFDVNRGAQTFIPRIGRSTYFAVATNHRYALRSPGAQEGERELRVERSGLSWHASKVATFILHPSSLNLSKCLSFSI